MGRQWYCLAMSWSHVDYALFFIHAAGVLLICLGLFLYEDEEGRFQNKVEEWWIRLSDKQKVSRSAVAAFMQEVARLTGRGFDRLFGRSLFSPRIIPVSIYLSIASIFLLVLLVVPRAKYTAGTSRQAAVALFVYFLALALVPAIFKSKWILTLWWAIIPAALLGMSGFLVFVFKTRGARSAFYGVGLVLLVFVSSLVCDLIYITLTRQILRRISRIDHIHEILLMIFLNLLALAVPVFGPVYAGLALTKYAPMAGAMVLFSIMFNSIDFFAGFAAFFLALLLLVHRLLWPAVQRPLYAVYRFAPIKKKKWLVGTGVALLTLTSHTTLGIAKALVKAILAKL
jgi:hypothetical protein